LKVSIVVVAFAVAAAFKINLFALITLSSTIIWSLACSLHLHYLHCYLLGSFGNEPIILPLAAVDVFMSVSDTPAKNCSHALVVAPHIHGLWGKTHTSDAYLKVSFLL
jgi:hypothetical protein